MRRHTPGGMILLRVRCRDRLYGHAQRLRRLRSVKTLDYHSVLVEQGERRVAAQAVPLLHPITVPLVIS